MFFVFPHQYLHQPIHVKSGTSLNLGFLMLIDFIKFCSGSYWIMPGTNNVFYLIIIIFSKLFCIRIGFCSWMSQNFNLFWISCSTSPSPPHTFDTLANKTLLQLKPNNVQVFILLFLTMGWDAVVQSFIRKCSAAIDVSLSEWYEL